MPMNDCTCPTPDFAQQLRGAALTARSFLCVGLDPEPSRFPAPWTGRAEHIFDFCAAIVDATAQLVCAFKPQIAYFAAHAAEAQLERLIAHIRQRAPHVPIILDAKRGDIGSTAEQYAREAFVRYNAHALTVSPFMGLDTLEPYLHHNGRGLFALCRTSNPGGDDFQAQPLANVRDAAGQPRALFEHLAALAQAHPERQRLGLVVGATRPAEIERVRALAPTAALLIPGVGAQGGDAVATVRAARPGAQILEDITAAQLQTFNQKLNIPTHEIQKMLLAGLGNVVINSSRAIIYASQGADFAIAAQRAALQTRNVLNEAAGI